MSHASTTKQPIVSRVAGRLPVVSDSRWVHLIILALPFAAVIVGWYGLSHSFNAFQGATCPSTKR